MPTILYDAPGPFPLSDIAYKDARGTCLLRVCMQARPRASGRLDANGMGPYLRIEAPGHLDTTGGEEDNKLFEADPITGRYTCIKNNGPFSGTTSYAEQGNVVSKPPLVYWLSMGSFPLRFAASLAIVGGAGQWDVDLWTVSDARWAQHPDPKWATWRRRVDVGATDPAVDVSLSSPAFAREATFTHVGYQLLVPGSAPQIMAWDGLDVLSANGTTNGSNLVRVPPGGTLVLSYGVMFP